MVPSSESSTYPLRSGNAVSPLIDGGPAFRRICQAVDAAKKSVWVTVAFLEPHVALSDAHGTLFDVLDRAARRGLDVRALFWRSLVWQSWDPDKHFHGTDDQRRWLEERRPQFLARWDELPKTFCHHQKSWIVDAGTPDAVGFVGGINLLRDSIVPPGHPPLEGGESTHDVYLEIRGPCTTDVQHNFVQRWNGASLRSARDGAWPDPEATTDLEFPRSLAAPAGDVEAQITRTMRREAYRDGVAAVGGRETAIERGEKSALEQYVRAIDAARRTIYVEDQTIASLEIMTRLEAALGRGVAVGYLVPARANRMFAASRGDPRSRPMFEKLARLGEHERFTLLGITSSAAPGRYVDIYVHAKIMLVDDEWATIGSTNVADRSFHSDTELNASFWSREATRALRVELLREHTGRDTGGHDDGASLASVRELARANSERRLRGEALHGLVFALDASRYGDGVSNAVLGEHPR